MRNGGRFWKVVLFVSIAFFIFACFFSYLRHGFSWGYFVETVEVGFCEPEQEIIKQPWNSISSIFSYVTVGVIILFFTVREPEDATVVFRRNKIYGVILGCSVILLGLGSAYFHAALTRVGGFLDTGLGMYFVGAFLFSFSGLRFLQYWKKKEFLISRNFVALFSSTILVAIACYILWPEAGATRRVFAILTIAAIASELRIAKFTKPKNIFLLYAAAISYAIGFMFWKIDVWKVFPDFCFGHPLWHFFTALSIFLGFYFFFTEKTGCIIIRV